MHDTYSLTEAKAKLSEIINRVIFKKETFTITKKGKAVATVVPVEAPFRGDGCEEGLACAAGALSDLDGAVEDMLDEIYSARAREQDRKVDVG